MDALIEQFKAIADVCSCAIELTHHVRKAFAGNEDHVYTAQDSRGPVAFTNAVRSLRVLNPTTPSEAKKLSLDEVERKRCFRIDIQKAREFFVAQGLAKDTASPAASSPAAAAPAAATPAVIGPTKDFTEDDVNAAVKRVVDERTKDGAFVVRDPKINADLNLIFEQVKSVRGMAGYGWFANTIFHDKDEAKKQYAIDFWFKPEGQELKLMDIRVQKGPKQEGDNWTMITRMPVAWWWLPVQEHPGSTEVTRAWHVMSAIHNYIATHKDKDGNLEIKDDKTGENLPLEFVEIHQPVRHLKKEGEYFACTDFRKPGSQDEYYDIDFWVNQKTGKLEVDNVKVHKVPVQQDGVWTQVPRYNFEGMDIEETN